MGARSVIRANHVSRLAIASTVSGIIGLLLALYLPLYPVTESGDHDKQVVYESLMSNSGGLALSLHWPLFLACVCSLLGVTIGALVYVTRLTLVGRVLLLLSICSTIFVLYTTDLRFLMGFLLPSIALGIMGFVLTIEIAIAGNRDAA